MPEELHKIRNSKETSLNGDGVTAFPEFITYPCRTLARWTGAGDFLKIFKC